MLVLRLVVAGAGNGHNLAAGLERILQVLPALCVPQMQMQGTMRKG